MKPEYKISKDKLKPFVELNDININIEGYESPIRLIIEQIASDISKKTDETIYEVICRTGVVVDKDELIKALEYDRDQYEKGYRAGYKAALNKLPCWARILLMRRKDNEQRAD